MDDEVDKEGNWVPNSFTLLEIVTHAVFYISTQAVMFNPFS